MEKILKLIDAGDQDVILDKKEKVKQLEILFNNDMISIQGRKLFLTKKGEFAMNKGVNSYLEVNPFHKIKDCSEDTKMRNYIKYWNRKRKISISVWILLLLLGIILRYSVT